MRKMPRIVPDFEDKLKGISQRLSVTSMVSLFVELSGTESAILNRELRDSESCDSIRAIPRSL